MLRKTRSILEEIDQMYIERDLNTVVESRAETLINGMVRLLEYIDQKYDEESAQLLNRKLLNAIRARDASKFTKRLKEANTSEDN
jgi:hypothetical protein